MIDITQQLHDSGINNPIFYAMNLDRIPSVGTDHVDAGTLLYEVAALSAEVRTFTNLRDGFADIRNMLIKEFYSYGYGYHLNEWCKYHERQL